MNYINTPTDRINTLKAQTLNEPRYMSIEQARLITQSYQQHESEPRVLQRAHALAYSLRKIDIRIDALELIVGNRSSGIRGGVVSPEAGIHWLTQEIEELPIRPQDTFNVRQQDIEYFREILEPYWRGKTLEDIIENRHGDDIRRIKKVVKINQTDHAQGHIIPNVEKWLRLGPSGIAKEARNELNKASGNSVDFLNAVVIVMEAALDFINRYAVLARSQTNINSADIKTADMDVANLLDRDTTNSKTVSSITTDTEVVGTDTTDAEAVNLKVTKSDSEAIAEVCESLAKRPPENFREALQSIWFLFVILQMESNASSFSPGRLDQYLWPYLKADLEHSHIDESQAQELLDALWIKFNQIVYMRSAASSQYFAGFPIGFNVAIGGIDSEGRDAVNPLSMMLLKAQEHIGLSQPNLTARLWRGSPDYFVKECVRIIGLGTGMPQIVNDESIIPSLVDGGMDLIDARNYAVVGCVELSASGCSLGWNDAAMFNLVKALELTLNGGQCLINGDQPGPTGPTLADMQDFNHFQTAFKNQVDAFFDAMIPLCDAVDRLHAELLPSPFLSGVIDDCVANGMDVTEGGAKYNMSGIQIIQAANVADSLAVLKKQVFEDKNVNPKKLLNALRRNFQDEEFLRRRLIHQVPKYGNDVEWVDRLGAGWVEYFANRLKEYRNARGGPYLMGLYTVSAHVPMGRNVGATPDGRLAGTPLADGGMSAVSGRDIEGPTALLHSVSRMQCRLAANGTLLNLKFLPRTFTDAREREKFVAFLKTFTAMKIHHIQFNVVDRETLLAAKANPDHFRNLTIRVAGYTAYFVDLAADLQDEIIARTAHGL